MTGNPSVWDKRIPGDPESRMQSKTGSKLLWSLRICFKWPLTFPESSQEPRGCPGSVLSHPATSQCPILVLSLPPRSPGTAGQPRRGAFSSPTCLPALLGLHASNHRNSPGTAARMRHQCSQLKARARWHGVFPALSIGITYPRIPPASTDPALLPRAGEEAISLEASEYA